MATRPIPGALVGGAASNADSLHTHVLGSTGLTSAGRASIWPSQRPLGRQIPTVIYHDSMGTSARWTVGGGTCTLTNDTVNFRDAGRSLIDGAWVADAGHALKITKTTADATPAYEGYCYRSLAPAVDWTKTFVYVRYYVHAGAGDADPANLNGITLYIWSGGGYRVLGCNSTPGYSTPGVHECVFPIAGNTLTPSAADKITISITTTAQAHVPVVTVQAVKIFRGITGAIPYIFTFDDGTTDQYAALAYLAVMGIRAHVYVITGRVGTGGYFSWSQLAELQAMGHLIGNHTETHTTNPEFHTLDDATILSEIDTAARKLRDNLGSPYADYLATPGAKWNNTNMDYLLGRYVAHTRDRSLAATIYDSRSAHISLSNPADLAAEQAARATAITNGGSFVLLCHNIATNPSLAEFKQIVNDVLEGETNSVSSGNVYVTNFAEIMAGRNIYA